MVVGSSHTTQLTWLDVKAWAILFSSRRPAERLAPFPLLRWRWRSMEWQNIHEEDPIVIRGVRARLVTIGLGWAMGILFLHIAHAGTATKEEIDAALKFYDEVKADS